MTALCSKPAIALLGICAAAIAFPRNTCAADNRYKKELEPALQSFIERQQIPGLAIAVVKNDQVVYARGFGRLSLAENKGPVTTGTVFHMASIVKPFTATAILQLVDQRKISLDAPVTRYVPYFKLADPRYRQITVRQMVAHTSGMPDVDDYGWDRPEFDESSLERYVRSLTGLRLLFDPGLRFAYSNIAYDVLGDVIARASGVTYEAYIQGHILRPLRMQHSTLLYTEVPAANLSDGHVLNSSGLPVVSKAYPYNRAHSPSSNLHADLSDMVRWARANMNRGVLDGARILPDSAFTAMWKPTEALGEVAAGTHVTSEGISWYLGTYRRHFLLTHSGGDLGFITDLAMLPTEKIAVIWMANCDWIDAGPLNGPITYAALDAALGLKPQPITLKRSLARTLQFTYQQEGIDSALREYRLLKDRDDGLFDFSEKELAQFGRYLHTVGQDEAALSVLQINAASFPESLDARRDLADAQLRIKR